MINAIETVIYTGKTHTTGGRNGHARSADGRLDVNLSHPGTNGAGTNPEQLLGAGWSACFLGAIARAAQGANVAMPADAAVNAEIDLGQAAGAYFLAARLHVSLPGVDRQVAQSLASKAHEICPYSKATRGNIDVEIHIV